MRQYLAMCIATVAASVVLFIGLSVALTARAQDVHFGSIDGWSRSGAGVVKAVSPGEAVISTAADEVTKLFRSPSIPSTYRLRFRQRIASFGSEQGVVVYDGAYRMMMYFRPDGIAVRRRDGQVVRVVPWSADADWHDYEVVVDHGRADLFMDRVAVARWFMHRSTGADQVQHWTKGPALATIRLDHSELTTHNGYLLQQDWSSMADWSFSGSDAPLLAGGRATLSTANASVSQVYANPSLGSRVTVNFSQRVLQYGSEQGFVLYNGTARAMLYFNAQGIRVRQADGTGVDIHAWRDALDALAWHQVEVVTHDHQGHLYVDGRYAGEWNLHPHSGADKLEHWVKGPTTAKIQIDYTRVRTNVTRYHNFMDDFSADNHGADPNFWMETNTSDTWGGNEWRVDNGTYRHHGTGEAGSLSVLHTLASTVLFEGDFRVNASAPGAKIYVNVRRNHEEARIVARYDLDSYRWQLIERDAKNQPVRVLDETGLQSLPAGWNHFQVVAIGPAVWFVLNGQMLMSTFAAQHVGWGRVGLQTKRADVSFDNIAYLGDAPVQQGVRESLVNAQQASTHGADIVRLSSGDLLMSAGSHCYVSGPGGDTWTLDASRSCSANMLVLPDGRLIRALRQGFGNTTYRDFVEVSSDGGHSYGPRRYIQSNLQNRITMPNKISRSSTGRVFFASGESGDGQEVQGGVHIYYSDNDGWDWTASVTEHNMATFGLNLQEGKVVEIAGSYLKAYFRTDTGYLYESESTNGGVDWSTPRPTPFRATMTSFNIERDPDSGDHYLVWEYEDTDEIPGSNNNPRERIGLAVSHDGTRSWDYVMDVDDWIGHPSRHMNHGLKVIDGRVWIYVPRRDENHSGWHGDFKMRLWRIDIDATQPTSGFPGTH